MVVTRHGSVETREGQGGKGPQHGGPGAGSTMAKGNSAGMTAHPAGNPESTGHGGVPTEHPITGTVLPEDTGAGKGSYGVHHHD